MIREIVIFKKVSNIERPEEHGALKQTEILGMWRIEEIDS